MAFVRSFQRTKQNHCSGENVFAVNFKEKHVFFVALWIFEQKTFYYEVAKKNKQK